MKQRVISAVVLFAIVFACIPFELTRVLFFGVVGGICAWEYAKNLRREKGIHCTQWVYFAYLAMQAFLALTHSGIMAFMAWFIVAVYLALFSGVLHKDVSGEGAIYTLAGLSYPCFPFAVGMIIAVSARWAQTLALGCISCWVCDIFALFGGKRFGKHKLAPNVSPKKTIEGSLCGTAASLLAGLAVYIVSRFWMPIPFIPCMVTALVASTLGQIGDLTESLIKRYLGVKDFSNLIPGHGGMFDRCDSLMFSIPGAYLCLYLFGL